MSDFDKTEEIAVVSRFPPPARTTPVIAALPSRMGVLDGWRTISVSMVIFSHLLIFSSVAIDKKFHFLGAWGGLGVKFFFVISGFVICRGMIRECDLSGKVSMFAFYVRRAFRILPPLWLYITVVLFLSAFGLVNYNTGFLLRDLTFLCSIGTEGCGGYVVYHFWSLAVEEQFYLVFPFIFVIVINMGRNVIGSAALFFPVLIVGLYAVKQTLLASFLTGFLFINGGIILALFEEHFRSVLSKTHGMLPIACLIILLIVSPLLGANTFTTFLNAFLIPSIAVVMIASSIFSPSIFSRFLSHKWMMSIGRISYGIYLWQQLATNAYPGAGIIFYIISIPAGIALAYFLFFVMELRLINIGARLSSNIKAFGVGGIFKRSSGTVSS
jgi:peptidoglycan/LPS O-acetylase OafA/YrhL